MKEVIKKEFENAPKCKYDENDRINTTNTDLTPSCIKLSPKPSPKSPSATPIWQLLAMQSWACQSRMLVFAEFGHCLEEKISAASACF